MATKETKAWKKDLNTQSEVILGATDLKTLCLCITKAYRVWHRILVDCIKKRKAKRAVILRKRLCSYLTNCHFIKRNLIGNNNIEAIDDSCDSIAYKDVMAAFLSRYIDVTLLSGDLTEKKKRSIITTTLFTILGSKEVKVIDAVFNATLFSEENGSTFFVVYKRVMKEPVPNMTPRHYVMLALLTREWISFVQSDEQKSEVKKLFRSLALPTGLEYFLRNKLRAAIPFELPVKLRQLERFVRKMDDTSAKTLKKKLCRNFFKKLLETNAGEHEPVAATSSNAEISLSEDSKSLFFIDVKGTDTKEQKDIGEEENEEEWTAAANEIQEELDELIQRTDLPVKEPNEIGDDPANVTIAEFVNEPLDDEDAVRSGDGNSLVSCLSESLDKESRGNVSTAERLKSVASGATIEKPRIESHEVNRGTENVVNISEEEEEEDETAEREVEDDESQEAGNVVNLEEEEDKEEEGEIGAEEELEPKTVVNLDDEEEEEEEQEMGIVVNLEEEEEETVEVEDDETAEREAEENEKEEQETEIVAILDEEEEDTDDEDEKGMEIDVVNLVEEEEDENPEDDGVKTVEIEVGDVVTTEEEEEISLALLPHKISSDSATKLKRKAEKSIYFQQRNLYETSGIPEVSSTTDALDIERSGLLGIRLKSPKKTRHAAEDVELEHNEASSTDESPQRHPKVQKIKKASSSIERSNRNSLHSKESPVKQSPKQLRRKERTDLIPGSEKGLASLRKRPFYRSPRFTTPNNSPSTDDSETVSPENIFVTPDPSDISMTKRRKTKQVKADKISKERRESLETKSGSLAMTASKYTYSKPISARRVDRCLSKHTASKPFEGKKKTNTEQLQPIVMLTKLQNVEDLHPDVARSVRRSKRTEKNGSEVSPKTPKRLSSQRKEPASTGKRYNLRSAI